MILSKIEDPRDRLQKAHRYEIYQFAKANGVTEIKDENMPANVMRQILRARGITNIKIPPRPLGAMNQHSPGPQEGVKVVEVNADADLERQYLAQNKEEKPAMAQMSINELRAECKTRGIKLSRRDTMETMRKRLNGEQVAP